jgi:tRNA threonylcarbamoyladenosine biosynthesis protein TsaB
MKILALDTTTQFLCLGLYENTKVYSYVLKTGPKLSALLTVTIDKALDALGWEAADIDYFACGLGPGSFTGVRIGMSAIKGFAWALHKPVVGIPTLDLLARNAALAKGYVAPLVDAKRGLIYTCFYRVESSGLKRMSKYLLLTPQEFFRRLKKNTTVLGDAVLLYKQNLLRSGKGLTILDSDDWYPKPYRLIELALERIKAAKLTDAFKIKPIYLYPKECQIRNRVT